MNLTNLFNQQRKLDEEIERKHPAQDDEDRLEKRIVALLVELGECANEWRGFKFWSENQNANTWMSTGICGICAGTGTPVTISEYAAVDCWKCGGEGETTKNPLLEEYVDCLHFILSIGIELNLTENLILGETQRGHSVEGKLMEIYYYALECRLTESRSIKYYYEELFDNFIDFGKMLGFTWEQIVKAYNDKNNTNWERQANGY